MSTVLKFIELAEALERALSQKQWELAEDLLAERQRVLELVEPGSLDDASRDRIRSIDGRCMKYLIEMQTSLVSEAKRRQRVARYGSSDY
ncbi:MAG: hypothetical protein VX405_04205 [Myxococcota bacterium]|nr:hypothetical protein [Myxococcota bacterium]